MGKYFNTTGLCVPRKHYMVNIEEKLIEIEKLIDKEKYFTINKPRQYGKTTTLSLLKNRLKAKYLIISCSFEGIGDAVFNDEGYFCKVLIDIMAQSISFQNEKDSAKLLDLATDIKYLNELSKVITKFITTLEKEVVLFIDEVDKSSNNQLFLSFLGMLRNKYLLREQDEDVTFKAVILAGVYDVKTLKLKITNNISEKYNSPWNIAVDFTVDMSFSSIEISTMLQEYCNYNKLEMDIIGLSEKIYFYTGGYPFLVSRICQVIDEKFYDLEKKSWYIGDIEKAIKIITLEGNTLFQTIVKNLENNEELYDLTKRILVNGENVLFNILDPLIESGVTCGIFTNRSNVVAISNRIFEEVIYNYILSKLRTNTEDMSNYNYKTNFITKDNGLDIHKILQRFQQYIRENYSDIDKSFLEREGRLVFLSFITPIINGTGFALKEVQIAEEKRLDVVITYNKFKYIIELKIWRGESYHKKGLNQLKEYLDIQSMKEGYLLVFNFNKDKEYKEEKITLDNKEIQVVYV